MPYTWNTSIHLYIQRELAKLVSHRGGSKAKTWFHMIGEIILFCKVGFPILTKCALLLIDNLNLSLPLV